MSDPKGETVCLSERQSSGDPWLLGLPAQRHRVGKPTRQGCQTPPKGSQKIHGLCFKGSGVRVVRIRPQGTIHKNVRRNF